MRPILSWLIHYRTPGCGVRQMVVEAATKTWALCGAVMALEGEGLREIEVLSCAALPTQPLGAVS